MATINLFRHAKDTISFQEGQAIFREGDPGNVMYVLVEGQADILIHGKLMETVGPGGILGEMALIENRNRSGAAIARTDCKVVAIDEKRFQFLIQETPFFAIQVMRIMAQRLRHMNELT